MEYEDTPDKVEIKNYSFYKEAKTMAAKKIMIRIRLKAYDHKLLDEGPIPLPTEKEIVTILRSPHVNKDSREQFEQRTHKRIIDVYTPSSQVMEDLGKLDMPAGVSIEIKQK